MYQFKLFLFMKKSTVMLGAIFGTLLMGCSDEEIANVETSSRNAIGFNVLTRVRDKDCVKNRVKRAKIVRFTLC